MDAYYASASSDQRLPLIRTPLLLLNAFDDPIVPGASLELALANARANEQIFTAITSHGGHLGWCDRVDDDEPAPFAFSGPAWAERVTCGFLETALDLVPAEMCETIGCEIFD